MRKIGTHLSISGGIFNSLIKAKKLGINALQIFLRNPNRWNSASIKRSDIDKFNNLISDFDDLEIFAHSGYLINLAGEGENLVKSIKVIKDEIQRALTLNIQSLVIHPGNHKGIGGKNAIERIAIVLDTILDEMNEPDINILLETTAGQGTSVGCRFEQLNEIINLSAYSDKLYVCFDTSHVFAAGYDLSTREGYIDTMKNFNDNIGFEKLKLIHLNDSKKECRSRVDRHEHIGKGFIGENGFKLLLNDNDLHSIPVILETPKHNGDEADIMNLNTIERLIGK